MKAGIANSLSARCAGACPSARTKLRRKKRRTAGARRSVPLFQKMGRKKRKEGEFRKKVHKFSFSLSLSSKKRIFFSQKIRPFETKFLLLRLIKHNFPFIPPHCGVHIAQSRGTFPDPPAQTLFDLLNHRDFSLSLPIGTCPKRRCHSQSGDICTTETRPLGFIGKEGGANAYFSSTRKGHSPSLDERALGKPIRFLSCPLGGESDHHYLIFGGFFCRFEVYRTAI